MAELLPLKDYPFTLIIIILSYIEFYFCFYRLDVVGIYFVMFSEVMLSLTKVKEK